MSAARRAALRAVNAARRARDDRRRTPPQVRLGRADGRRRIFYLSPDPPMPRGGVRVFYQHVDLLRAAGFDATVVHCRRGYRAGWFANDTAVAGAPDVTVTPDDVLVVPEYYGGTLDRLPAGPTVVVLNQGVYHTFDAVDVAAAAALVGPPVSAVLTVSEDSLDLLRFTFAGVPVHLVRPTLDRDVFHPGDGAPRGRRIAYAANRRADESHHLRCVLEARGRLAGWELVPIVGMSEAEVADTMRSCPIFLSMNEREGFGLQPAEAMACGCFVVGYTGQGAREFFDPRYSAPVPDGALLDYARAVEEAVAAFEADPDALTRRGLDASAALLARYDEAGLRGDLVAFFRSLGLAPAAIDDGAGAAGPTAADRLR
ncbi:MULTISPECIES: glycosyltransferase [unclassified Isoptericola]|uniref:glycosyltransferase n=1 Tax=unclassified Isoptericola TaxID=2623355 RepID=UPI003667FFFC